MSEHGTFVTGWVYCDPCREAVGRWFAMHPEMESERLADLPVASAWAGAVRGTYVGAECDLAASDWLPRIASVLCPGHGIEVAVLGGGTQGMFWASRATAEDFGVASVKSMVFAARYVLAMELQHG